MTLRRAIWPRIKLPVTKRVGLRLSVPRHRSRRRYRIHHPSRNDRPHTHPAFVSPNPDPFNRSPPARAPKGGLHRPPPVPPPTISSHGPRRLHRHHPRRPVRLQDRIRSSQNPGSRHRDTQRTWSLGLCQSGLADRVAQEYGVDTLRMVYLRCGGRSPLKLTRDIGAMSLYLYLGCHAIQCGSRSHRICRPPGTTVWRRGPVRRPCCSCGFCLNA